jgi:hypothetical protein
MSDPSILQAADAQLSALAARGWLLRRQHVVRELGIYVPLRGRLPCVSRVAQDETLRFWRDILGEIDAIFAEKWSYLGREDLTVPRQQVDALTIAREHRDFERPFNAFVSFWDDTPTVI